MSIRRRFFAAASVCILLCAGVLALQNGMPWWATQLWQDTAYERNDGYTTAYKAVTTRNGTGAYTSPRGRVICDRFAKKRSWLPGPTAIWVFTLDVEGRQPKVFRHCLLSKTSEVPSEYGLELILRLKKIALEQAPSPRKPAT